MIPKAGPGTINALDKQTELHSEAETSGRRLTGPSIQTS